MIDRNYVKAYLAGLSEQALLALLLPGVLVEEAQPLLRQELLGRGLNSEACLGVASPDVVEFGSFETLARFLNPTEAHLLAACLQANNVPAFVADANTVQMHMLLGSALGGVRLQVPRDFLKQAQELKDAYDRGEFALIDRPDPDD